MYTFDDVAVGRRLIAEIGRHQWQLGDLALKVAPWTGPFSGGEILNRFADDIGVAPQMLGEYRRMAYAWPSQARVPGASYTLHRELYAQPDRIAWLRRYVQQVPEGKRPSLRGLQKYRGQVPTLEISRANLDEQLRQGAGQLDARDRAKLIFDLLADRDTAHCYATLIASAAPPPSMPPVRQPAWRQLVSLCDKFATGTGRVIAEGFDLDAEQSRAVAIARDRAATAVAQLGDAIRGGGSRGDIDAELSALIRAAS